MAERVSDFRIRLELNPHCGTTLRVVNRDAERRATILQKNIAFGDNDVGVADVTRFERVQQILDEAIGGATANIGVHQAFWRGLTRDQFINKAVMGHRLIQLRRGAESNLVKALKGEPPFGVDLENPPPEAEMSRMPAGLPPVSPADIAFIQKWIDDGCQEDEMLLDAATFQGHPTTAPIAQKVGSP